MPTGLLDNPIRQIRKLVHREWPASDGQLLNSYLVHGDHSAFEVLVKRHGSMVLGVCQRILQNRHDVEDAFQATFLVLVRKAASITKRDLVGNWLYGVAFRAALKMKRAKTTRQMKERQAGRRSPCEAHDPIVSKQLFFWLDHELENLAEKYRAPLVLCDLEGMTRNDAAKKLGWSLGSLNWRLAKARSLVADGLKRHGLHISIGALTAFFQQAAQARVPASLLTATVKLNGAGAGNAAVSTTVASITDGVVKAMVLGKLKIAVMMVLMLGALAIGVGGITYVVQATENAEHQERTSSKESPPAAGQVEVQFGNISVVGSRLKIDAFKDSIKVSDPGSLKLMTTLSLKGEKLRKPEPLTIQWTKHMLFSGKSADFHGAVQVWQGNDILRCEDLYVTFDRVVSVKKGHSNNKVSEIEKLVCNGKVCYRSEKQDADGRLLEFERLVTTQVVLDSQGGSVIASGPGRVEYFMQATPGDLLPLREIEITKRNAAALKLTRITFEERMVANNVNEAHNTKFYNNVEVFEFMAEAPDADFRPGNIPKNGSYMRCDCLSINQGVADRSIQVKAEGKVLFRTPEIIATSAVLQYDKNKETLNFVCTKDNHATLVVKGPNADPSREFKGTNICYKRKTGEITIQTEVTDSALIEAELFSKAELAFRNKDFETAAHDYRVAFLRNGPRLLTARERYGECCRILADQADRHMKSAKDEKIKTYHQVKRQSWLERGVAAYEELSTELDRLSQKLLLDPSEHSRLRKATFCGGRSPFRDERVQRRASAIPASPGQISRKG